MTDKTYYIYEVPGVKIGCTTNPEHRIVKQQSFSNYNILAKFNCIYIASFMERFYQKEYGFKYDNTQPYYASVKNRYKWTAKEVANSVLSGAPRKGGLIGGKSTADKKVGVCGRTKEQMTLDGKVGGIATMRLFNKTKMLCPDGKITSRPHYKRYCLARGLDPTKAVKIENNELTNGIV